MPPGDATPLENTSEKKGNVNFTNLHSLRDVPAYRSRTVRPRSLKEQGLDVLLLRSAFHHG